MGRSVCAHVKRDVGRGVCEQEDAPQMRRILSARTRMAVCIAQCPEAGMQRLEQMLARVFTCMIMHTSAFACVLDSALPGCSKKSLKFHICNLRWLTKPYASSMFVSGIK